MIDPKTPFVRILENQQLLVQQSKLKGSATNDSSSTARSSKRKSTDDDDDEIEESSPAVKKVIRISNTAAGFRLQFREHMDRIIGTSDTKAYGYYLKHNSEEIRTMLADLEDYLPEGEDFNERMKSTIRCHITDKSKKMKASRAGR